jgi:NADH-quinone oxidoreductase subunit N
MMLIGIALIYEGTGTFNYSNIQHFVNLHNQLVDTDLELGRILILLVVILKLGGAPMHAWAPDLYDSQPTHITQYLLIVPKIGN